MMLGPATSYLPMMALPSTFKATHWMPSSIPGFCSICSAFTRPAPTSASPACTGTTAGAVGRERTKHFNSSGTSSLRRETSPSTWKTQSQSSPAKSESRIRSSNPTSLGMMHRRKPAFGCKACRRYGSTRNAAAPGGKFFTMGRSSSAGPTRPTRGRTVSAHQRDAQRHAARPTPELRMRWRISGPKFSLTGLPDAGVHPQPKGGTGQQLVNNSVGKTASGRMHVMEWLIITVRGTNV